MLEAAGGGGGGTPWELMSVETMYELVHSADTSKQWDIVGGWQKSAELVNEHRFQVQDYRDNLASAWPPERSAAAAAYLERLDQLIANLNETYEATLANHDALSAATGSIYQAQSQMDKIYQEYTKNKDLLSQQAASQQSSTATPTPSPGPSGDEPLVAPGRQEELRQQAVTLMSSVSTDLAAAQLKIVTPPKYDPGLLVDDKSTPNNGTTYVAPTVPFVTPTINNDTTSATSSRPSSAFPTSNSRVVSPVTTAPVGSQPGLVLGGTGSPVINPPITGTIPTLPGGGGGPLPTPGPFPSGPGYLPGGGSAVLPPTSTGGRGGGLPREGYFRNGGSVPEGMRAMPPGGVIGGTPGIGGNQQGRVGTRRVNPVGGIIGEGGSARGSGARTAIGQPYGQASGRRPDRRSDADSEHWDPDNPWETADGVAPVVLPPREQRIDPGPAIGLG